MLEDLQPAERTYSCKVRTIANSLSESDRDILLAAAESEEWGFKTLEKALAKKGIRLLDTTIAAHRRQLCGCYR